MKNNLLSSTLISYWKIIARTRKIARKVTLLLFLLLIGAHFGTSQKIPDKALSQIKSLMDDKASRTPAQKKINSQILYKAKMQKGKRITAEVDSLQTGVVPDANGKIKVDIDVDVTPKLLNSLRKLDCEILYSSEKGRNIVANVPLDNVEQVAMMVEVKFINYWIEPILNNNFSNQFTDKESKTDFDFSTVLSGENKKENSISNSEDAPDFNSRTENVKKQINEFLNQGEINGTNLLSGTIALATSEGDKTHKAALARGVFNVNGSGVKIGVISDSYDTKTTGTNAADDIASGDLPGPGNPNGFLTPVTVLLDYPNGSDEGRAMLQIIHDLAPGAQLYFASAFVSQASFAQQILDLRAAGCDIIVDDVTYFAEGVFQDDNIAQAVNTVTADGALYFSSAGNSGNKNDGTAGVWEGDYIDGGSLGGIFTDAGNVHDFGGGILFNTVSAATGYIFLKWSDPLGLSGNDYDLVVTNSTGTSIVAYGGNLQDGNDNPFEAVVQQPVGNRIYIFKSSGVDKALHLNTNRGRLLINTPGVMYGHNAAGSAYTVAATPAVSPGPYPGVFNSSNSVETFSSDGPRRIFFNPDGTEITPGNVLFDTNGGTLLQKPDITAADGVANTLPGNSGLNPFYGTSAAAPHAAAIAALIKSKLPGITPTEIRTALTSSAIDIEAPGLDRDAGAGIIMTYEALLAAGATPSNSYIDLGIVTAVEGAYGNGNGTIEPGELASMTVQLTNDSPNTSTNVNAVLTSSTPGVTITDGALNYGDIPALSNSTNTTIPYIFGIASSVECGALINFTLTVNYGGGGPTPQVFNFSVKTGATPGTITATLGSAPPSGTAYVSSSGIQTNRLNRNGIIPTCGIAKATPVLQEGVGTLKAYHAYTFLNDQPTNQCVTVSVNSASNSSIYEVVYGEGGYNPASIQSNYLADQGTTTNRSTFSFDVPANQHFTVVVHEVVSGGGIGLNYNLNVGLSVCAAPPACTPVVLSPASIPGGIVDVPYNQTFSATGGSGSYLFSLSGTLPQGISFSNNTLSGTATETGSFPITVTATDATGCPAGILNYTLDISCPVASLNPATVVQPTCALPTGTITVNATSDNELEYSIDNGLNWQPTAIFSDLPAGNYLIKIRIKASPTCETTYSGNPIILVSPFSATAIDTWTGCVSTDWSIAGNWQDGTVPTATDNVLIPSSPSNQPVIGAGSNALAKSVIINNSAILTVDATGSLYINGSVGNGFTNNGTVNNSGSLVIGNTTALTGNGIVNSAVFNNNTGGEIFINKTKGSALNNQGVFTNEALMIFGATASVDAFGILNYANFENKSGGEIKIDRVTYQAIQNLNLFLNSGIIRIGAITLSAQDGIYNANAFTNLAGGEIFIDRSWGNGIWNATNATTNFQNSGKIVIGANASTGISGILNYRIFSNNEGGEIQIDRPTNSGIVNNNSEAVFTNAALIRIGTVATIAANGIQNSGFGTFNNNSGGEISVDRTGLDGIKNISGSDFINSALINIGSIGGIVGDGIDNSSSFSNNSCATINLSDNLNNTSSFTNSGFLIVNTVQPHTNTALTNDGVINYFQGNSIPNVTNNDLILDAFSSCENTPITPALQIGGSNSFEVGNTWYSDQSLTQMAGTYDQNSNTFTVTNLVAGSTHTLYFSITDLVNSCAKTVSIDVTLNPLPIVSAGSYGPVCINSGLVTLGGSPLGGTWSGNGISGSVGNYKFDPTQGTQALTYSFTDGNSCLASSQTTIVVTPLTIISTDPSNQTIYALTNATFSVAATGTPPVTYQWQVSTDGGATFNNLSDGGVYAGSATNNLDLSNTPISMNGYQYKCVVTGGCSTVTSESALLTVMQRPTTLSYNGDLTVQYSDQVNLSATLTDDLSSFGLGGRTITFTIGAQSITAVTNSSGIATANLIISQAPGTSYSVDCLFAGDVNELTASDSDPFSIVQEDARVEFTGTSIVATTSATSGMATVTLRTTVQDISATSDAAGDFLSGDIRKAKVRFLNEGSPIINTSGGTDANGWITPTLVNVADLKSGIVSLDWPVNIGIATDAQYRIGIEVSGYYSRFVADDNTIVTVYKPTGDFITGGGYIKPTMSAGTFTADPGLKTNFGFNVGYNKNGKNIRGNMNILFRRTVNGVVHTFQIKANSMTSLGVNIANPSAQIAVFVSKANLTDITNPLAPISFGGNLSLQVSMTDKGEPGSKDLIGISLYDGSTLMYSSNWTGSKTAEILLGGGNLIVRSGFSLGSTVIITTKSAEIATGVFAPSAEPIIKAYPNPFMDKLNIEFSSTTDTEAILEIYSITGAKLHVLFNGPVRAGELNKVEYLPRLISSQMILYHLTMNGETKIGVISYQKGGN